MIPAFHPGYTYNPTTAESERHAYERFLARALPCHADRERWRSWCGRFLDGTPGPTTVCVLAGSEYKHVLARLVELAMGVYCGQLKFGSPNQLTSSMKSNRHKRVNILRAGVTPALTAGVLQGIVTCTFGTCSAQVLLVADVAPSPAEVLAVAPCETPLELDDQWVHCFVQDALRALGQ